MPRTIRSTSTPAWLARYSASTISSSTIELTLIWTSAGRPAADVLDLPLDPLDDARAHAVRRDQQPPVRGLPAVAGEHVEQVGQVGGHLRVGGQQPEVLVDAGPSSGGSCRCRCGSSGAAGRPPAAPPSRSCSGSSARPGRRRRGSRPAPASGPSRCWPARRSAPSPRPAPPPACRPGPRRSARPRPASRRWCGRASA